MIEELLMAVASQGEPGSFVPLTRSILKEHGVPARSRVDVMLAALESGLLAHKWSRRLNRYLYAITPRAMMVLAEDMRDAS